jgi:co-chaperonin GroES (HSP10)
LAQLEAESSSRILPKINRRRAKSSRLGRGRTNDEGRLFPLAVKEGDCILFGKYSGTEIKIDGEDFLIMKEEEVLGVISGAAKKETVGAKK